MVMGEDRCLDRFRSCGASEFVRDLIFFCTRCGFVTMFIVTTANLTGVLARLHETVVHPVADKLFIRR